MAEERRLSVRQPELMAALTHPVRLKLLEHLMAAGPATASQCARAVGDTPSNCSYHLRTLAKYRLVAPDESGNGRDRPYRALVTGLTTDEAEPAATDALLTVAMQLEQQSLRDYLTRRDRIPEPWRAADTHATYVLRMTAAELTELGARLDALIRPYIASTRDEAPDDAALIAVGVHAYPKDVGQ
jgi:DNA-binding transcriptional ArsR family regulator